MFHIFSKLGLRVSQYLEERCIPYHCNVFLFLIEKAVYHLQKLEKVLNSLKEILSVSFYSTLSLG